MKPSGLSLLLLASLPLLTTVSSESEGGAATSTVTPVSSKPNSTEATSPVPPAPGKKPESSVATVPAKNVSAVDTSPDATSGPQNKTMAKAPSEEGKVNGTVVEPTPTPKGNDTKSAGDGANSTVGEQSTSGADAKPTQTVAGNTTSAGDASDAGNKTVMVYPTKAEGLSNSSISNTVDEQEQKNQEQTDKNLQTDGNGSPMKEDQPKSDKKMLWILLPVLGVLVAAVIFVLKSKCMKGSSHSDAAENGTENASFQSRSDCNKDGVMLLGVKTSSGGEDNAAAR
ncbi:flocculation protein FLO11-like isoform X2 [Megalops cyprinoides]|uniref:flocculation protein FLO11-like isoform X2 n=1 Tax=Megalops cyprinoides TaxID=118141 RepID=UPI001864ED1A|nr:flocculation protein FLO11-like isoform X2 [Megalops cyprinoides]